MALSAKRIKEWYFRFERPISSISLIGGFVFDALTLKRIDLFWDNLWVLAHFIIIGACIVLINVRENIGEHTQAGTKAHFWLITTLQFFFGGLLSTFIVFYFRSGTLSVTWPFLLLLAAAFIANESLKKHYTRLAFQISLFFLSLFSFAIFIVPVLVHSIGPAVFVLSGLLSILALYFFLLCLHYFAKETFAKSRNIVIISVLAIFLVTNILYFCDLIPPLPLSLKDGGIYHSLYRGTAGYVVTTEDQGPLGYFSTSETFHEVLGDPVFAYSAVFSPALLNTTIFHEWQKYDQATKKWLTFDRIKLAIVGGREGGYNTYSLEDNITPGEWRVNVKTASGQIIGQLRFTVIGVTAEPPLITETKN
jgi:hypothetical protein